jgi:peroxiredoxin
MVAVSLRFLLMILSGIVVQTTQAAILHLPGTDSTANVRSLYQKKTLYLSVEDAARALPLLVRLDSEAGLLVLCSAYDCVPVFMQDSLDVQFQDSAFYLKTDRIAEALNCRAQIQKKSEITLACPEPMTQEKVGVLVGERAPGFVLHDAQDSVAILQNFLKRGPVVLAFVRSGDWDPYSRLLLKILEAARDTIRGAGYQAVVLHGYEPKVAAKWKKDLALTMPILSDQYSAVMRGYDVFDKGHLPRPAFFVLDRTGTIRLRLLNDNSESPPDLTPIMEFIKNR